MASFIIKILSPVKKISGIPGRTRLVHIFQYGSLGRQLLRDRDFIRVVADNITAKLQEVVKSSDHRESEFFRAVVHRDDDAGLKLLDQLFDAVRLHGEETADREHGDVQFTDLLALRVV